MKILKRFTVLLIITVAAAAVSCRKTGNAEDDKPDDGDKDKTADLFVPDKNLTAEQRSDLIREAVLLTSDAEELTVVLTGKNADYSHARKKISELNRKTRKFLSLEYNDASNDVIGTLSYIDGFTELYMHSSSAKYRFDLTDAYWDRLMVVEELREIADMAGGFSWQVSDTVLTANWTGDGGGIITVTLDAARKIKNVQFENTYDGDKKDQWQLTAKYTAAPVLPVGYGAGDFATVTQHSLKVIWGTSDGKNYGENTFYITSGSWQGGKPSPYIELRKLTGYFPEVPGKKPEFYTDANFSQSVAGVNLSSENAIIYAKWVNNGS
ncbi:MAG: hypothetical protein LBR08_01870 [Bacteroidales bacterium]|jgi:hypothetical protein|nr:hypothetical protein [Bacteroidales bacterium]